MRNKIKKIVITVIILCILGIPCGRYWYNNHKIEFKDVNMAKLMAEYCGKTYSEDMKITPNDMKEVRYVELGYVGYYDTLVDLKWCKELEELKINMGVYESNEPAYQIAQGEMPEEVAEEKVNKFEEELGKILPKMKQLKKMEIISKYGCEWGNLDFLEECGQIEELTLYDFQVTDYSILKQCKSLKKVVFFDCPISKAEDLMGLENLEWIGIRATPLANNPEELKKLKEAYPDAVYKY